jgi:hypothetical protein
LAGRRISAAERGGTLGEIRAIGGATRGVADGASK